MKDRTQLVKLIESEIEKVNKQIDRKIVKGLPYIAEGRKHTALRALLAQYASQ